MDRIGRYKIVRELGRGAMGVVYHAIDPNIGRPVAIKTIQIGGNRKPEDQDRLRERLFREARSAGVLSHPGIVTVYDVEQQGDLAYIAMEYVDGLTLDQLMSQPKALEPEQIFSILAQTAAALDYAHQKGIVHRDIKPANIMIAADGTAKIADFGIAKVTEAEQFTMTGSIVGTPHYMSPEQVQGQAVDGRSDQFSLAVIAYEMLTGEKPYTGEHLTTVVYKIVAEEPVPPHRFNASLTGPIENVLRKGLAKRPDSRYRSCTDFVNQLEQACATNKNWKPLARGAGLVAPTLMDGAAQRPSEKTTAPAMPPGRRPQRSGGTTTVERTVQKKSGFLPFLLAILMAAALLALIGWQAAPWLSSDHKSAATTADDEGSTKSPQPPATTPPPQTANADGKQSPMPPAAPGPDQSAQSQPGQTPPANGETKPIETQPVQPPPDTKADSKPEAAPPSKKADDQPKPAASASVEKNPPSANPPASKRPTPPARNATLGPQPIHIITSPNGATATLDGRSDTACTTPCTLTVSPGRHTISFNKTNYQFQHRDIDVIGDEPEELDAVILKPLAGTIFVSSTPVGATIHVNGKLREEVTPAQLSLPPGTYTIVIEKNGLKSTGTIDLHNGELRNLSANFGQQ